MLSKNVTLLVATMMMSLMADQLAGTVQKVDKGNGSISVEGVAVSLANAAITGKKDAPLTASAIKEGAAVVIEGLYTDGVFEATMVQVVKKVKHGILEGTVEAVNSVVKNIIINGVKVQIGDKTDVQTEHGYLLALEMIQPGAKVYCKGEWQDGKLFYAKMIKQVEASKAAPAQGEPMPPAISEGADFTPVFEDEASAEKAPAEKVMEEVDSTIVE